MRNSAGLKQLLDKIYDPTSPYYHHYIRADEFAARFGPTEADYQQVITFARANGFTITSLHPNRTLLGVTAAAGDVERAFGIRLRTYPHPTEARLFFAAAEEPAVAPELPIRHVSGLNNFTTPHPMSLRPSSTRAMLATAPHGHRERRFIPGQRFPKRLCSGTALRGAGQKVGLFELNGILRHRYLGIRDPGRADECAAAKRTDRRL